MLKFSWDKKACHTNFFDVFISRLTVSSKHNAPSDTTLTNLVIKFIRLFMEFKVDKFIVDHYYCTISHQLTYVIVMFTFRGLALQLVSTMSGVMLLGAGTCVCACMHACAWGHMKGIT